MIARLEQAIDLAQNITCRIRHFRLAAIALRKDGSVVSAINNATRTPNIRAHAESRVLIKAGYGATIFVARVLRDGTPAMAKPCYHCEKLLRAYRVKKVYYTINYKEFGCIQF